jgi:hypothetical protein
LEFNLNLLTSEIQEEFMEETMESAGPMGNQYASLALFNSIRWLITVIVGLAILGISLRVYFWNVWFGIFALMVFGGLFIYDGYRNFKDIPPTGWMPQVFGRPVNILKPWGPAWIPFRSSFTIGYKAMSRQIMHADLKPAVLIPGDRSTILIPTHMFDAIDPNNPMQLFMVGGIDEAQERLEENIRKILREWVTSPQKGPVAMGNSQLTLDRARQMNNEAINEILESLAKDQLVAIPSDIPTEVLIGYFTGRPPADWEKECIKVYEAKSAAEKAAIKQAVLKRLDDIAAVKGGKKPIAVHTLGLIILQMIVDNIEPDETTARFVADVAKENFESERRKIRATSFAEMASILKPQTNDLDAMQAAFIAEDKTKQEIKVTKFELSPALSAIADKAVDSAVKDLIPAWASRISGRKEDK